jgi:glutamate formiminotransferase
MRLLECIPNVSEGRDPEKITLMAEEVRTNKDVRLLDVSSDKDHHRSVFTFIGPPEGIRDAALSLSMKAIELIDMRGHRGGHPRVGAVDVVPFVPIQGLEMKEAVQISREFGRDLGRRGVPVFYYEESATSPERRELPFLRKGEYEGLEGKLKDPRWKPDEGPADFNPKSGATVVGARFPLIAYNVNLKTEDLSIAREIAKRVRFKDGGFPHVRAMGVALNEKGMVQVSLNLTNYRVTNVPEVFEFIKANALERGVEIDKSEIVGLIPLEALEGIVRHYIECPEFSVGQVLERRVLEFE